MKIGVISDSHRNLNYLRKAADYLVKKEGVDWVVHLGDDYTDSEILKEYGVKTLAIPGVYDPEYKEPEIVNRVIEEFGDLKVMISHTVKSHDNDKAGDLVPEEVIANKEVDIYLFGHTHIYDLYLKDNILYLNPGHLKEEDIKGKPASFSLLEIEGKEVDVKIIRLDGEIVKEGRFTLR